MQTHTPTTPFGRRTMSLGMMASQAIAKAVPEGTQVQKWKVFHSIREARELIGATDRSLSILNALLSFHPETELSGDGELIVWPSNEQLTARGQRHAGDNAAASSGGPGGLWADYPERQPKRQAVRSQGQGRASRTGLWFWICPRSLRRAEEFSELAEAIRAEKNAFRVARERLTLLRRRCRQTH